jgi:hypothetical protein
MVVVKEERTEGSPVQPRFSLRAAASAPPPPGRQAWVLRPDHLFDPALRLNTASTQLQDVCRLLHV